MKYRVGLVVALALGLSYQAQASDYVPVPAASQLGFQGKYQGASFDGQFHKWNARISYDPAKPEQTRIDVTVNLTSATTGDSQRDSMLPAAEFFAVKQFPNAHFVSEHSQRGANGELITEGKLELKGITRPLNLKLRFKPEASGLALDVTGQLQRLDYQIGSGEYADPSVIANPVIIHAYLRLQQRS